MKILFYLIILTSCYAGHLITIVGGKNSVSNDPIYLSNIEELDEAFTKKKWIINHFYTNGPNQKEHNSTAIKFSMYGISKLRNTDGTLQTQRIGPQRNWTGAALQGDLLSFAYSHKNLEGPIIVYLAGHGGVEQRVGKTALWESSWDIYQLRNFLDILQSGRGNSPTLLVVDHCYAGAMLRSVMDSPYCGIAASNEDQVTMGGGFFAPALSETLNFSQLIIEIQKRQKRIDGSTFISTPTTSSDLFIQDYAEYEVAPIPTAEIRNYLHQFGDDRYLLANKMKAFKLFIDDDPLIKTNWEYTSYALLENVKELEKTARGLLKQVLNTDQNFELIFEAVCSEKVDFPQLSGSDVFKKLPEALSNMIKKQRQDLQDREIEIYHLRYRGIMNMLNAKDFHSIQKYLALVKSESVDLE